MKAILLFSIAHSIAPLAASGRDVYPCEFGKAGDPGSGKMALDLMTVRVVSPTEPATSADLLSVAR